MNARGRTVAILAAVLAHRSSGGRIISVRDAAKAPPSAHRRRARDGNPRRARNFRPARIDPGEIGAGGAQGRCARRAVEPGGRSLSGGSEGERGIGARQPRQRGGWRAPGRARHRGAECRDRRLQRHAGQRAVRAGFGAGGEELRQQAAVRRGRRRIGRGGGQSCSRRGGFGPEQSRADKGATGGRGARSRSRAGDGRRPRGSARQDDADVRPSTGSRGSSSPNPAKRSLRVSRS